MSADTDALNITDEIRKLAHFTALVGALYQGSVTAADAADDTRQKAAVSFLEMATARRLGCNAIDTRA